MIPPIFLISLTRSPRYLSARAFVAETSLPVTLFHGVDGLEFDLAQDTLLIRGHTVIHNKQCSRSLHRRLLSPGEAGCSLSHFVLYQMCREQELPAMMILEDDFQLLIPEDEIIRIISKLPDPDTYDFCYLQSGTSSPYEIQCKVSSDYFKTPRPLHRTHGYIVTQRFVRKVCKEFTLHSAADGYLGYFCNQHPDTTILVSYNKFVGLSDFAKQSDTWNLYSPRSEADASSSDHS